MLIKQLSIDPSGEWSPVQARKVLEIINPEAESRGIRYKVIDVSTFEKRRVLLIAYCIKHDRAIIHGSVCEECVPPRHYTGW